jgi:hypothetical protein
LIFTVLFGQSTRKLPAHHGVILQLRCPPARPSSWKPACPRQRSVAWVAIVEGFMDEADPACKEPLGASPRASQDGGAARTATQGVRRHISMLRCGPIRVKSACVSLCQPAGGNSSCSYKDFETVVY